MFTTNALQQIFNKFFYHQSTQTKHRQGHAGPIARLLAGAPLASRRNSKAGQNPKRPGAPDMEPLGQKIDQGVWGFLGRPPVFWKTLKSSEVIVERLGCAVVRFLAGLGNVWSTKTRHQNSLTAWPVVTQRSNVTRCLSGHHLKPLQQLLLQIDGGFGKSSRKQGVKSVKIKC